MTPRRLVALCAVALALSLTGAAHAAGLSLSSPQPPTLSVAEKCAQAEVEVSGSAGQAALTVSGIPQECAGLPLHVWLHEAGTTHEVATTTPPRGGQVTVTPPGFTASARTAVLATVDTWPMPTTAVISELPFVTCRTPDDPAVGCDVRVVKATDWPTGDGQRPLFWNRQVEITTASSHSVRWELVLNLSAPSIPVQPTRQLLDYQNSLAVTSAACDAGAQVVTVQGTGHDPNFPTVRRGEVRRPEVEGRALVAPPAQHLTELLRCR